MYIPENIYATTKRIVSWGYDRNIIGGSTSKDQLCKLVQEVGEVSDAICKEDRQALMDAVGDVYVVLAMICEMNDISIYECAEATYNEIAPRKGVMFDGVFVKSTDKEYPEILKKLGREE